MKFNSFLWQNFTESRAGRESIEFFSNLRQRYLTKDNRLITFIEKWAIGGMLAERHTTDEVLFEVTDMLEALEKITADGLLPRTVPDSEAAESYYQTISDLEVPIEHESVAPPADIEYDVLFEIEHVPALSVALYCLFPHAFFPYYFFPRFYQLAAIFREFGIFMPPVPPKKDSEGRFLYYMQLNRSLQGFAAAHGMEPQHMPAFLYHFASEQIEADRSLPALPPARRAWFVGGGVSENGDFEYLDSIAESSQTAWQGNLDTRPGDIVVVYCLTPRSCTHSVWRALRNGASEPFRHFYSTIWIGSPQLVPGITLKAMRDDPILRTMPLVRANMQGINGREIPKEYYDRLRSLWELRGADVGALPTLDSLQFPSEPITNERDVEIVLLEPLLRELGYEESEWTRQLKVRVGRTERAIPDYVLLPKASADGARRTAFWIWEAKLSISTHQQLAKDFEQAASYARLLDAEGAGLISREGVWLGLRESGFELQKAHYWSSAKVGHPDALSEMRKLLGKRGLSTGRFVHVPESGTKPP